MDLVTHVPQDIDFEEQKTSQERSVRLSVNLSQETAQTLRGLIGRKGLSITEGIRRAIAVWKFVEDETSKGNQLAVIERDNSVKTVILL
jgi:hypothetical protein